VEVEMCSAISAIPMRISCMRKQFSAKIIGVLDDLGISVRRAL
jgi:hypothetical protein